MKTNHFTCSDHESEQKSEKKHSEINALASKLGEHFGKRNLPKPKGDSLIPYVGSFKHAYEEVSAFMHQRLQPDAHLPEATMKIKRAKERDKHIDSEISEKSNHISNSTFKLGDYHPNHFIYRFWIAIICTGVIFAGDTNLNAKSFEFLGGSYITALILAISLSLALFLLAHTTPLIVKSMKKVWQQRLVIVCSLSIALGISTVFAYLRSAMFASQNTYVSPSLFVEINMFLYIVSGVISFFVMPTWEELKEHLHNLERWLHIKKTEKQVVALLKAKEINKDLALKDSMEHFQIVVYAKHFDERIVRMYRESVQIFINTNLIYRTDGQVPDCFHRPPDDPDMGFKSSEPYNPNNTLS
ncbi:MAG TPA: hypothetical protein VK809_02635 [Bacteroidia bacterium]|jgi:hypothetical protein|nr:hypothetical protein [Bacteroidia bacterium]